jgi:hypothetical protein
MQSAILRAFQGFAKDVAPLSRPEEGLPYIGGIGMRRKLAPWALAIAVAVFAMVARSSLSATPPAPATQPVLATTAEPHPEIRDAIGALERARDHLQHAAHDFGGHREAALRAIDVALRQLHDCQQFDRDDRDDRH